MHANSRLLFQKYARDRFHSGMKVLEIGPNAHPSAYCSLVDDPSITWDTVDLESAPNSAALTYRAENEYRFPLDDDRYDIVVSGQVIEHVRKVWVWMREVARVCKRGGTVITIHPVNWPYHEGPVDCWRIYPEGMRALYEEAELDVEVALFEQLDHGNPAIPVRRLDPYVQEARNLARRLLGKPWWPLGAWQNHYAVDGVVIGRKR
jgi:SAM-dependent methyltransferase